MRKLRDYQERATSAVMAEFERGRRSTLLVMPTGTGKTVTFAEIAKRTAQPTLVVAHREELLTQASETMRAAGVRDFSVASIQSLSRKVYWPRPDSFGLLVLDEAHHAAAKTYRSLLGRLTAKVLGVTATPDRLDKSCLSDVFESCAFRYTITEAQHDGWLCPVAARRIVIESVDLSRIDTVRGDLNPQQLAETMEKAESVQGVAGPLLDMLGERRCILFASSVAHAKALETSINLRSPGLARAVSGENTKDERLAARVDFAASRFRVLVNCQIYTEGFDDPGVSLIAVARPTKSRALYAQMVGRGMRLSEGKADLLLLDFVGATRRHDLAGPLDVFLERDATPAEREAAGNRLADGETSAAELVTFEQVAKMDIGVEYKVDGGQRIAGVDQPPPTARFDWETANDELQRGRAIVDALAMGMNPVPLRSGPGWTGTKGSTKATAAWIDGVRKWMLAFGIAPKELAAAADMTQSLLQVIMSGNAGHCRAQVERINEAMSTIASGRVAVKPVQEARSARFKSEHAWASSVRTRMKRWRIDVAGVSEVSGLPSADAASIISGETEPLLSDKRRIESAMSALVTRAINAANTRRRDLILSGVNNLARGK